MEGIERTVRGAVLTLVLLVGSTTALARLGDVYLKNGLKLRGDITETDQALLLRNAAGELSIPRTDVVRLIYVGPPDAPPTTQPTAEAAPPPDAAKADPTTRPAKAELAPAPAVSREDIQRLRLHELVLEDEPENVRVQFKKVDGEELTAVVLAELRLRPDFEPGWETILTRGRPNAQLQLILRQTGTTYADYIAIMTDTEVFTNYRKRVLPLINQSCARSGCHWGTTARVFRLPVGSRTGDAFAYTSFVLLDQMETPRGKMVNRVDAEDSLLLQYMLPQENNDFGHPPVSRGPTFKPVIRNWEDPNYEAVVEWIRFLQPEHPDYELEYDNPYARPAGEVPVKPAETPAAPKPDAE